MNKLTAIRTAALGAALCAPVAFGALPDCVGNETVELWPIEWNSSIGRANTRAVVDPGNDLTVPVISSIETGIGTPTGNSSALFLTPSAYNCLYNESTARYLTPTNDFTLEGWINLKSLPAAGTFFVIASAPNLGDGRWLFSLRVNGANYEWQLYSQCKYGTASSMGDRVLKSLSASEMSACLNKWTHWALTYTHGDGEHGAAWHAYVDYQELGDGISFDETMTSANAPFTEDFRFTLAGRPNASNTPDGSVDFVRLTREVLDISEFMTKGAVAPDEGVIAHWPLTGAASGKVNVESKVGDKALSGAIPSSACAVRPSSDQAFSGNLQGALSANNCGSWRMTAPNAQMKVGNLGKDMELTKPFTVEGWINMKFAGAPLEQYVFYTRDNGAQWNFQLAQRMVGGVARWQFEVFAQTTGGSPLQPGGSYAAYPISGDVSSWKGWKHIALTYDPAGATDYGVWRFYADGVLQGGMTNALATSGLNTGCVNFYLGGRKDKTAWYFNGDMDCFRVCKAVLTPEKFLNGSSPSSAEEVAAFWPLDVDATGAYLDGRDETGAYPLVGSATYSGKSVTPVEIDGTNVTRFCTSGNTQAYLALADENVMKTFVSSKGYTLEAYLRREEGVSNWELVFGVANEAWNGMALNLSYRTNGFVLYYSRFGDQAVIADFPFDANVKLDAGRWYHLALVVDRNQESGKIWFDLYLDGTKVGNTQKAVDIVLNGPVALLVGGRSWAANSFRGEIRDLRLTGRALTEPEFLYHETNETKSAAFWTIDTEQNGSLNLGNHIDANHPLKTTGSVVGDRLGARSCVPNPDTTPGYIGDPSYNRGSAAVVAGSLVAGNCGGSVSGERSFTVEGWVKWLNEGTGTQESICGTLTQQTPAGWKLVIDSSGATPVLKIVAGLYGANFAVDSAFGGIDLSQWKDAWRHVALVYDPFEGKGVWRLYVDGALFGSVENVTSLYGQPFGPEDFVLGENFVGSLDMWRVSEGVLTVRGMLYRPPLPFTLIVR